MKKKAINQNEVINLRISTELLDGLKAISAESGIDVSKLIRQAIVEYMEREAKTNEESKLL